MNINNITVLDDSTLVKIKSPPLIYFS